jgi:phosphoglycerate dehydrogenase-like enzyme
MGTELRGKKQGLVGFGRIGQLVAEMARAFGMELSSGGTALSRDTLD